MLRTVTAMAAPLVFVIAISSPFSLAPTPAYSEQSEFQIDYNALSPHHFGYIKGFGDNRTTGSPNAYVVSPHAIGPLYGDTATQKLKSLIARAEAPHLGYDAVVRSAWQKPIKPPSQMKIKDIYTWIRATPNQNHAIGRYQFIPQTLKRLVTKAGMAHTTKFNPETQDILADLLLEEAGYDAFLKGQLSRHRFMNRLARIWAGLPTSSGRSYYHGYAGNRATISWASYDTAMREIFTSQTQRHSAADVR